VDTDIPVYLDGRARQLLAEGRSAFARLGLRDRHRVAWGNDTLLLPWRGDQIMNTLAAVVSAAGAEVGQDGVALTVHLPIDELDQILLQLRNEEPPAPEDLAKAVTNLAADKYDQFLGEDLARRGYAARSLDVPGTWSFLRELDAEIYSGSRSRDGGHAIGIAQVAQDDPDPGAVSQQLPGLPGHHRVVVHVHDPALRVGRLHHLVGVAHGRQPRPDIDELADPLPGYPSGRPLVEPAVGPGAVSDLWHQSHDALGGITVGLEVVLAS
jgi:hypothetical protein